MRVATVTNYFEAHRGGVEIVAGMLARGLAARGVDLTWLAASCDPPPEEATFRTEPVAMWNVTERRLGFPFPIPSPGATVRLFRRVAQAQALILHDSLCPASVCAFAAAKLARRPVLLVQHIGAVPYRSRVVRGLLAIGNRLAARTLLRGADQVVFISQTTADFFADVRFRAAPLLIHNGVDTAVFHPAAGALEVVALRSSLGLAPTARIALFVGRFVEKKGLGVVRRAAESRPDVTWLMAGWGAIDPAAWGLPNVRVMPGRSGAALAELYRLSDVLVLPSRGEGFPLVIQEALACGLPAICGAETLDADPAAAPWLRGVDVSGSEAASAKALAHAVDEAFAAPDGDKRARARFAADRYAWPAIIDRYQAVLASLAGAGSPGRSRETGAAVAVKAA